MMKYQILITILSFVLLNQCIHQPAFSEEEDPVDDPTPEVLTLPAGTPISVVLMEKLFSQRNREGDEILFFVAEDVVLMDRTCLVAGTPVLGRMTEVEPARSFGRGGYLFVEIISIMPLYTMTIPLASEADLSGIPNISNTGRNRGRFGGRFGVTFYSNVVVHGSGGIYYAGFEKTVFSAEDTEIMDIGADEMREYVDDWLVDSVRTGFMNYTWDENCTVAEAIASLGYDIELSDIAVVPIEDFHYRVILQLSDTEKAEFTVQPFEDPHMGKFITLNPQNDLAQAIFDAVT